MFKRYVFLCLVVMSLLFNLTGLVYSETYKLADYMPSDQGDKWIYKYQDTYSTSYVCNIVSGTEDLNGISGSKLYAAGGSSLSDLGDCINTAVRYYVKVQNGDGTITNKLHYILAGNTAIGTYTPKEGSSFPVEMTLGQEYPENYTIAQKFYKSDGNIYDTKTDITQTETLVKVEDITVPAGNFKNCLKIKQFKSYVFNGDGNTYSATFFYWYAKNVGLIKQEFPTSTSILYNAYVGGVTYNTSNTTVNNCAATLSSDLKLHIPILTFNGQSYWADLQYTSGANFTLSNAGAVTDTSSYSGCTAATLSSSYKLHIPALTYNNVSYWADFQYSTTEAIFTLTGAAAN